MLKTLRHIPAKPLCAEDPDVWTQILDLINNDTYSTITTTDRLTSQDYSLLPDFAPKLGPVSCLEESFASEIDFSPEELDFLSQSLLNDEALDFLSQSLLNDEAYISKDTLSDCIQQKLVINTPQAAKKSPEKKRRLCTMEECGRIDRGHGLCGTHGGGRKCNVPDCPKASRKKGLCCGHYRKTKF